jgi:hypothetical protein
VIPLQARCAQRVGRGIALLFHDCGTRRAWVVSSTPWPHFTPGKEPVPILQEAGWAPGPVWTCGKSCRHQDSIPDRPACNQSLYRLSYPAHKHQTVQIQNINQIFIITPANAQIINVKLHCNCSNMFWCPCTIYPLPYLILLFQ